ncbi:MAG: sigma-54-dependent Fis family transcriptional regulator [bacterium]|nr:sigma-54-dependent Fis family transcriptional regulator [bacterium]
MAGKSEKKNILVITNDEAFIKQVRKTRINLPVEFTYQKGAYEALQMLRLQPYDMVFIDYEMPLISGDELIKLVHKANQTIPVIVIVEEITQSIKKTIIKSGAVDFQEKPVDIEEFKKKINNFLFSQAYHVHVSDLRKKLKQDFGLENIIGDCEEMWKVFHEMKNIVNSDVTVFINGESGTGKELIARAIHRNSLRKNKQLVVLNCAAIPENLLESELFGHEKGSFSGAIGQRTGKFELADKGTVFLDEIGEMSLFTQSKILRVLEEQEFERVGGNKTIKVNVRIITATNKNLEEEVSSGRFREDLFYRINVYPIELPPLRERTEDIPLLAYYFIDMLGKKNNKGIMSITERAIRLLQEYTWQGNIRELENVMERAILRAPGKVLTVEEFSHLGKTGKKSQIQEDGLMTKEITETVSSGKVISLKLTEKHAIEHALLMNDGNISVAAKKLEIGRATLHRKINEYMINVDTIKAANRDQ